MITTTRQQIDSVATAAFNASLTGAELTPAYVAWWSGVSVKFARIMIQVWQAAGSPVYDL